MLKTPVVLDLVDVLVEIRGSRDVGLLLPLAKVIDAAVTVVSQDQINQPVAIEVTGQQVARPSLQLKDLDRTKTKVLAQG